MTRYKNTLLTPIQVKVLELRSQGKTFEEIAEILGLSKTTVYTAYKAALKTIEKARNTLKLYVELRGGTYIEIPENTPVEELLSIILKEADVYGIKITERSSNILLKIIRQTKCIDLEQAKTKCKIRIHIDKNGVIEVEPQA